ncbi:MAG: rhodanese-like domain-containing protein [Deltaproteobacteria bacterium]|nr:rhodanese-like domain-containing protein [Deltaproteobacteria bacterium]
MIGKKIILKIIWQGGLIILVSICLGLSVNLFRSNGLPLVGNWSAQARVEQVLGSPKTIPLSEAQKVHASGKAAFLDARPQAFYEFGHIKGAKSLPPELYAAKSSSTLAGLSRDALIITYCDGETCDLSLELAASLQKSGYSQVRVLVNGWTVWEAGGLPVETGPEH